MADPPLDRTEQGLGPPAPCSPMRPATHVSGISCCPQPSFHTPAHNHTPFQVRVIHLEAVADPADRFPPPYFQPRRGATAAPLPPAAPDAAGSSSQAQQNEATAAAAAGAGAPNMFADSVESLMRNVIQAGKIAMANEVRRRSDRRQGWR